MPKRKKSSPQPIRYLSSPNAVFGLVTPAEALDGSNSNSFSFRRGRLFGDKYTDGDYPLEDGEYSHRDVVLTPWP
jgi:hypothetical protein